MLALLTDDSAAARVPELRLFGLDPARVVEALRERGVRVPPLAPPVHARWRGGHRIIV